MTGFLYDDIVYVKSNNLMSTVGFNFVLITCTVINATDTHWSINNSEMGFRSGKQNMNVTTYSDFT
jgi:hypothetical protein